MFYCLALSYIDGSSKIRNVYILRCFKKKRKWSFFPPDILCFLVLRRLRDHYVRLREAQTYHRLEEVRRIRLIVGASHWDPYIRPLHTPLK